MADGLRLEELLARTALTAEASTIHKPLGKPGGPGLWHHKGLQLPAYIQSVAQHLRAAHGESRAIEMAVGIVKNWAAGHDGHGHRVHPDVQAAAAKNIAQWEALKARSSKVRRSAVADTNAGDYDGDGLDSSWDGDLDDLPDLTGLHVHHFDQAAGDMGMASPGEPVQRASAIPLGSGGRFKKLKASLAAKGAHDPGALAAWIGRKKYTKPVFQKLAAKARGGGVSRGSLVRPWPLEDIHIVSRAGGDGSGRLVEAYATVFDTPVEIRDHQGHYEEIIDRGAFDRTLERLRRAPRGIAGGVRVLYNHGKTMEGMPAPEFQRPIGKPLEIRPDGRGLVTRTEYAKTPLAEEILDDIKEGRITAQSFEGPDIRSDPALKGPGDRYRRRGGVLPQVRRMALGLLNYGPALFAANPHAEFLGIVRMGAPGDYGDDFASPEDEEDAPGMDGDITGGIPEEMHPSRSHVHRLWQLNLEEACRRTGIVLPGDET